MSKRTIEVDGTAIDSFKLLVKFFTWWSVLDPAATKKADYRNRVLEQLEIMHSLDEVLVAGATVMAITDTVRGKIIISDRHFDNFNKIVQFDYATAFLSDSKNLEGFEGPDVVRMLKNVDTLVSRLKTTLSTSTAYEDDEPQPKGLMN